MRLLQSQNILTQAYNRCLQIHMCCMANGIYHNIERYVTGQSKDLLTGNTCQSCLFYFTVVGSGRRGETWNPLHITLKDVVEF